MKPSNLDKRTVEKIQKNFFTFYRKRKFFTVFTRALHATCPDPDEHNNNNNNNNNTNSVALVRERTSTNCVVSAADPYGRNLGFLDRSCYFFFQRAPQLYSRG
jgi:hypothetical protein